MEERQDLISRQDALDALGEEPPVWYDGEDEIAERNQWRRDVNAIKAVPSAQPNVHDFPKDADCISRQAAIDVVDSETISTNPEHFKSSEKFIEFMDDSDISSFGKWQWSNGFNTALTAVRIDLKKLPSAQHEIDFDEWCVDCKEYDHDKHCCPRFNKVIRRTVAEMKEGD